MFGLPRLIRAVPVEDEPAAAADTFEYVRETELPDDATEKIEAGLFQPWRVDAGGEQWYRCFAAEDSVADDEGLDDD